ncbi:hypothetical protein ACFFTM_09120 [Pseudoduganella plicata]|uniref:Uncharacterized protein n=1 Tax=Pseudoduganella plicata TaxID=321984 RepID=A0A4P7BD06_9BURK|nr:hypothetical protein [Pseudoduganella plicata]QBQ35365.1 hypothetical protein E1742_03695 [Pseudoduganella plicata]GGZ01158.1 hypothetical protein GCM10007388_38530 [Pseudoduganella plicata]
MDICLSTHPVRLALSRFPPADASQAITFAAQREAEQFLRAQAVPPTALPALRDLLAANGAAAPAGDDAIWRGLALLLVTRRLHLVRRTVPSGGRSGATADEAPAPVPGPKRGAVSATPPVPPPSGSKTAEPAAEPVVERTAALDQDVQAAGLEQAHAGAKPFCAVCEQRRQERERQQAAGEQPA